MNKNFVNAVKNSGITPYRLSKYSGVPYTIISELLTGKKDINKRAADTVLRLAKALNLEISDIMNPVYVLDGVSGKYKGVSYRWKRQDDYMILSLKSRTWNETVKTEYGFQDFKDRKKYDLYAGLYIDQKKKKKKTEEYALKKIRGI